MTQQTSSSKGVPSLSSLLLTLRPFNLFGQRYHPTNHTERTEEVYIDSTVPVKDLVVVHFCGMRIDMRGDATLAPLSREFENVYTIQPVLPVLLPRGIVGFVASNTMGFMFGFVLTKSNGSLRPIVGVPANKTIVGRPVAGIIPLQDDKIIPLEVNT